MEISMLISILSLFIALLALPTSYFIAVHQVKVGLDEHERRNKNLTLKQVADNLGEFYKVFQAAVKVVANIEPGQIQKRIKEIDARMAEIDKFVIRTDVLKRLTLAIDILSTTGFADLPEDMVTKLQSIRNQILLGSDTTRFVTLGVLSACGDIDVLQNTLRKKI